MGFTNLFPAMSLSRDRGGCFMIRAFRKKLIALRSIDFSGLTAELLEQLSHLPTTLKVITCGSEGLAIYYPGIIEKARLRISFSPQGGAERTGRWDIWDPRVHKQYLSEMGGKRRGVMVRKGLPGVFLTRNTLCELDAFHWKVMFEQDLIFKAGKEISFC